VAEALLKGSYKFASQWNMTDAAWIEGQEPPTDQELNAVQIYLDTIYNDQAKYGGDLHIERRVFIADEHWGTADAILISPKALRGYDFKSGSGVYVPEDSLQGQSYISGAAKMINDLDAIETFEFVIVQPLFAGAEPVRRHTFDRATFDQYERRIEEDVAEALSENPTLRAGRWCQWCKHAHNCEALRNMAQEAAKTEFDDDTSEMDFSEMLTLADVVETWVKEVRAHAYGLAMEGATIPGYKLVEGRKTRKWKDEVKAAKILRNHDVDPHEHKMLSPAKAEKALGAHGKKVIQDLVTSEASGLSLVPDTDRRPAAKLDASVDFE